MSSCLVTLGLLSDGSGIQLLHICPLNRQDLCSAPALPSYPPSLTAVHRSKSPHPVSALLVSNYRRSRRRGSTVRVCACVCERVWACTKGLAALTCRKDVKSVITLADNKWFSNVWTCVSESLLYFTLSVSMWRKFRVYIYVCVRMCAPSQFATLADSKAIATVRANGHPLSLNVNLPSSTVIYLVFHFLHSLIHLSPLSLSSGSSHLPLFPSPTLCLWLTSRAGYLAGWLSESDIWIYYYTTLQVSPLRLSAPAARPCPCFSFSCALWPNASMCSLPWLLTTTVFWGKLLFSPVS